MTGNAATDGWGGEYIGQQPADLVDAVQGAINEAQHPLSCRIWEAHSKTCSCGAQSRAALAVIAASQDSETND